MKETIEHNNRFYGEELKTESEQLKEWLVVANKHNEELQKERDMYKGSFEEMSKNYFESQKEIERLKEELKYTIPIVEHNKTITKHLKEIERLKSIIKEVRERLIKPSKFIERTERLKLLEILNKEN